MTKIYTRDADNAAWLDTFCKGGWKMEMADGSFLTLTPYNFRMRNANNTDWLAFTCPIPVPATVTGGQLQVGALVDTAGYVWMTGYSYIGYYETGASASNSSKVWKKVRYKDTGEYVSGVKQIIASDDNMYYLLMKDGRVLAAGNNKFGTYGNGTGFNTAPQSGGDSTIVDVTAAWKASIGEITNIAKIERNGAMLMNDSKLFVIGEDQYDIKQNAPSPSQRWWGWSGGGYDRYWTAPNGNVNRFLSHWTRARYKGGVVDGIIDTVKWNELSTYTVTLALTSDGRVLQPSLMEEYTTTGSFTNTPTDVDNPNQLCDLKVAFTAGTPKRFHTGGLLEDTAGNLYRPVATSPRNGAVYTSISFKPLNINVNSFGSPVKKILAFTNSYFTMKITVFILLQDGRLLGYGDDYSSQGWFGNGTYGVALSAPTEILNNVLDFDARNGTTQAMKNDGTLWATGGNNFDILGVGGLPSGTTKVNIWTQCVLG